MKEVKNEKGLSEEPADQVAEDVVSAFGPETAPGLTLVTLMRIYDVLLAQYRLSSPEGAKRLHDLHAEGKILGSLPYLDLGE